MLLCQSLVQRILLLTFQSALLFLGGLRLSPVLVAAMRTDQHKHAYCTAENGSGSNYRSSSVSRYARTGLARAVRRIVVRFAEATQDPRVPLGTRGHICFREMFRGDNVCVKQGTRFFVLARKHGDKGI